MTCPICNRAQTVHSVTTLVFQKDSSTIIVRDVPAEICNHCDESFLFENVSKKVLDLTRNGKAGKAPVKLYLYAEARS
jgi:YgiT-type zinc finger domain-containing protein